MSMTLMPCNGPMATFTPGLLSGQVTAAKSRDQGRWTYGGMRLITSHSGAMRSIELWRAIAHLESRDSGSGPSDHPGMTAQHDPAFSRQEMPESCVMRPSKERAQG